MSMEKTDALVVKSVEFMESSLILTLFTRKFGKVRGLAKGARRLKNPFETSLDLLASIKLSFIRKNSDALDLLTEAKLARRFRPTARNFRGLYAGYYVAELLDLATEDYQPLPDLWTLADATLDSLQRRPGVAARVAAFETATLDYLGEFPSTRACVECGQALPLDSMTNLARGIWFELDAGGVVCAKCRQTKRLPGLIPSTIGALKLLETGRRAAHAIISNAYALERLTSALDERRRDARVFATELADLRAAARDDRDAQDSRALAEYEAAPSAARGDYRALVERYLVRTLRRRPRAFDYLRFALGDPRDEGAQAERNDADAQARQTEGANV